MSARVPVFFVQRDEASRLAQVTWMQEHLGMDRQLLARVLGCTEADVDGWRRGQAPLSPAQAQALDSLWGLVRHVLSLCASELPRARAMFDVAVEPCTSPLAPPWSGTTLREYLRHAASRGVDEALRWVTALRFGPRPAMTTAAS